MSLALSPSSLLYHCIKVLKAVDERRRAREFLLKRVRDVVSRIGGNDENFFAHRRQLSGQAAAKPRQKRKNSGGKNTF